jgi:hypothetical protein
MRFTEWVTQREPEIDKNLPEEDQLIENQLSQWVTRLAGLLQNFDEDKKQQLLNKVMNSIREIQ